MNVIDTSVTGLRGYSTLNQGWHMTMEPNRPIRFENQRFGVLEVGMVPTGKFDTWRFHENGGGGVLAVGFARKDDQLHVMMLLANRENLVGNDDWEIPGGFMDGSEAQLTGAARETVEETGVMPILEEVSGRHYVGNRAFFCLNGEEEGTRVFSFELTTEQVDLIEADSNLQLMPWQEAIALTRDALSGMAIARVVAEQLR